MTYTCAVFDNEHMSLEDAQANKLRLILDKLDLQPGQHLLDIGCGWGSMVITAARRGIKALGVTLSKEQAAYANEWIAREGLQDLAEVRIQDYREVPEHDFDGICSIGMMEHVGVKNYQSYFEEMFPPPEADGPAAEPPDHHQPRQTPRQARYRRVPRPLHLPGR